MNTVRTAIRVPSASKANLRALLQHSCLPKQLQQLLDCAGVKTSAPVTVRTYRVAVFTTIQVVDAADAETAAIVAQLLVHNQCIQQGVADEEITCLNSVAFTEPVSDGSPATPEMLARRLPVAA